MPHPTEMGPALLPAPLRLSAPERARLLLHPFLTTDRGDACEPSNGPSPECRLKSPWPMSREAHLPRVLLHPDARRIGSACLGITFSGVAPRAGVSSRSWCGSEGWQGLAASKRALRQAPLPHLPPAPPIRQPLRPDTFPRVSKPVRPGCPGRVADESRRDPCCVRRWVPSGFRFGSGGASPSAWRFQELGIVSWLADLRVACLSKAFLASCGARAIPVPTTARHSLHLRFAGSGPKTFPAGFPTLLAGIAAAPIGLMLFRAVSEVSLTILRVGFTLSTPESCASSPSRARGFWGIIFGSPQMRWTSRWTVRGRGVEGFA